ncbi:MAG: TOBE domain-containing protein, partial [Gemmatimonadota bacterium]
GVFLAIRAEDVLLLPPGIVAGVEGVAFEAIVRAVAPAEAGFRVTLDAGFTIVARVEKRTIAAVTPRVGEPVTIAITPATAHVLRS